MLAFLFRVLKRKEINKKTNISVLTYELTNHFIQISDLIQILLNH